MYNRENVKALMNDSKLLKEIDITPYQVIGMVKRAYEEFDELEAIISFLAKNKHNDLAAIYAELDDVMNYEEHKEMDLFDINYKSICATIVKNKELDKPVIYVRSNISVFPDTFTHFNGDSILDLDMTQSLNNIF